MELLAGLGDAMSKPENRHHAKRIKNNLRHYHFYRDADPRCLGIGARTKARCSCWMCGNPRKFWDYKTIQELKADDIFSLELLDL